MRYKKLRGRIVEKYDSIARFSEELLISTVAVSKKLNGKTGFSQNDMMLWGDLLDIKMEEYGLYFFDSKV